MKTKNFPEPQYEEIRVQVNYGPGFGWTDAVGWKTLQEAQKTFPQCTFREKTPSSFL